MSRASSTADGPPLNTPSLASPAAVPGARPYYPTQWHGIFDPLAWALLLRTRPTAFALFEGWMAAHLQTANEKSPGGRRG